LVVGLTTLLTSKSRELPKFSEYDASTPVIFRHLPPPYISILAPSTINEKQMSS
jgi:hypothetical protein